MRSIVPVSCLFAAFALGCALGCAEDDVDTLRRAEEPLGENGWLKGTLDEKLDTLADQQGSFARSMIEIGYRYQELHWAGVDENWAYAEHQLQELDRVLELAITRFPEHERAAEVTRTVAMPELAEAVDAGDAQRYAETFRQLTANCNACHALTQHPFIRIEPPATRRSPVRMETSD